MHTAISRKVVGKNVHTTIPKENMGYDQYTVPDDCSCQTYFCCFPLALANICPWPPVPFFSNFLEEQSTQNHPQYLLGLSRALFPTTFLEIAVYPFFQDIFASDKSTSLRKPHNKSVSPHTAVRKSTKLIFSVSRAFFLLLLLLCLLSRNTYIMLVSLVKTTLRVIKYLFKGCLTSKRFTVFGVHFWSSEGAISWWNFNTNF